MIRKAGLTISLIAFIMVSSCDDTSVDLDPDRFCQSQEVFDVEDRNFLMGFSTWIYAPGAFTKTYEYIGNHADIYSEQQDEFIPWNSYLNNRPLPAEYIDDIDLRVSSRPENTKLVLSVSLLNTDRSGLLPDKDGYAPQLNWSDSAIISAYTSHLKFLIDRMKPDYLVAAMEINDLYIQNYAKWEELKILMKGVKSRLKDQYPNLPLSESITLHNLYSASVMNFDEYQNEVIEYVNELDFAAISYYPFFMGLHSKDEFQLPINLINNRIKVPVAFTETAHLAESLTVPALDVNIISDECEQNDYLEVLLEQADTNQYEFVIWWTHRDYDVLWRSFPESQKDIGKVWRDTGILDEDGRERKASDTWNNVYR